MRFEQHDFGLVVYTYYLLWLKAGFHYNNMSVPYTRKIFSYVQRQGNLVNSDVM